MNYDQLREINMPIIKALRDLGTALAEQNVTGEVTVTLPYPWTVSPYGEMTVYTDCGQVIVKKGDVAEDDARKYENRIQELSRTLGVYRDEVIERDRKIQLLEGQKNGAYSERNQCVALLAKMAVAMGLKAGVREHPSEDLAWEPDWRTVVFIDLPTGQVSWHFHDSEKHLLGGLPRYVGQWDGHGTYEKYLRVEKAFKRGI
jgi:hypothetical protein